jgi:hypothetical protein
MSFQKDESARLLMNHRNLVLEKTTKRTQLLTSNWTRALVGALESTRLLCRILGMTTPNTLLGAVP